MALSKIIENSLADEAVSSAKLKDFAAAVDLNGVELVLAADADTSITADTDDRIDFKIANVEHFSFSNSSGDTIIKPMVDAKDIKFQQYDGRTLLDINDGGFVGIANGATSSGEIRFFEDTDNGSNYIGLNAGSISSSFTLTLPTADGSSGQFLKTDGSGALSFDTVSSAADDLTAGDAAVTIATSSGNITIDAQAGDTDIIFKGTDSSSDITALTLDMSDAGTAVFNHDIRIADDGQIGSASDADAIVINSSGVVTMNQIPVFSAGINVSGGSIAGTLSTAAQANVTSLGTLTTLTVDNVIINGTTIGHTDDTDLITLADGIATVAGEISVTTLDIGGTNVTSTAAELNILDGVTATASELNLLDGDTSVGSSITLADADGFVVNDGGTMITIPASDIKTYNPGGTAWQSVVTSNTTMVAGRGYFVNTAGGAITMTLPSSASQGDTIQIIDYAGTADTNNITIGRNSHKIQGDAADLTVSTERAAFSLVYVDATQGWLLDSK